MIVATTHRPPRPAYGGLTILCLILTLAGARSAAAQEIAPATASSTALVAAALARTEAKIRYDGRYFAIAYPGGDVPADIGVCTDVVIRSYRALGIDLQQRVHEDMRANFALYPKNWGLTGTDRNIDHRRVPNLQRFFERHGQSLAVSDNPEDYQAGDLVTWMLPGNLPHIGIVVDRQNTSGRPLIVHNIGAGPQLEDVLFAYPQTGHYRYGLDDSTQRPAPEGQ